MSLSDPRELTDFYDLLPVQSVKLRPQLYQQVDGMASGDVLVEDTGSPLWMADIVCDVELFALARGLDALINSVQPPRQFYLRDKARRMPKADPDNGVTLGAASVVVHSIGDDNASLAFGGLPVGYALSPGDFFHIDFGADPLRRGFFQLLEGGTADMGGLTAELAVTPNVWPGIDVAVDVTFIDASCKMMLTPGSLNALTFRRARADGLTFTAIEKL